MPTHCDRNADGYATCTSTNTTTITNTTTTTPTPPRDSSNHSEVPPSAAAARRGAKKSGAEPESAETWSAYKTAYFNRYQVEPIRNASVNSQLAMLVRRIGREAAPAVAAFYVASNHQFYVAKMHAVGPLVRDCEAIHTQWVRQSPMTAAKARQVDQTATNAETFRPLIEDAERGER